MIREANEGSRNVTRIAVVTDSTTGLSEAIVKEYGITVVPLNIHFTDAVYRDGVDIGEEEFFRKLAVASELPSTWQPSTGDFVEAFKKAAEGADGVIAVLVSSLLSGTYSSAMGAKDMLPDIPIAVVDTKSICMCLGMMVVEAARASREGKSLAEIVTLVEAMIPKMRVWFLLDTFKYLVKGGRVAHCSVIQAQAVGEAEALAKDIARVYPDVRDLTVSSITPVISVHTGPNTLGLCFYSE